MFYLGEINWVKHTLLDLLERKRNTIYISVLNVWCDLESMRLKFQMCSSYPSSGKTTIHLWPWFRFWRNMNRLAIPKVNNFTVVQPVQVYLLDFPCELDKVRFQTTFRNIGTGTSVLLMYTHCDNREEIFSSFNTNFFAGFDSPFHSTNLNFKSPFT